MCKTVVWMCEHFKCLKSMMGTVKGDELHLCVFIFSFFSGAEVEFNLLLRI